MKSILLTLVLFLSIPSNEINEIRLAFKDASKNEENARAFYDLVKSEKYSDEVLYTAYNGASEVILSKYIDGSMEKLKYFKQGAKKIDKAVDQDEMNIEVRFVRLVIQMNTPEFLNYNENIDEDKEYLLNHYSNCSNSIKKMISEYVSMSDSFSTEEKKQLK
ncbi:MAG: hypothetical protein COA32_14430 [Fluviicola sp.]|nr:MAG: hypothetical protein COA32_14430 [Fluviicola sp.]